jgi:hypothetical protein
MPSSAAITPYVFGAFLAGISGLLDPSSSASKLSFAEICIPVGKGRFLAAVGMGIYYALGAYQENAAFFKLTVPMRFVTATVVLDQGWNAPAVWERAGA